MNDSRFYLNRSAVRPLLRFACLRRSFRSLGPALLGCGGAIRSANRLTEIPAAPSRQNETGSRSRKNLNLRRAGVSVYTGQENAAPEAFSRPCVTSRLRDAQVSQFRDPSGGNSDRCPPGSLTFRYGTPFASWWGDWLGIGAVLLAAIASWSASRRSGAFGKRVWRLISFSLGLSLLAQVGFTYYFGLSPRSHGHALAERRLGFFLACARHDDAVSESAGPGQRIPLVAALRFCAGLRSRACPRTFSALCALPMATLGTGHGISLFLCWPRLLRAIGFEFPG